MTLRTDLLLRSPVIEGLKLYATIARQEANLYGGVRRLTLPDVRMFRDAGMTCHLHPSLQEDFLKSQDVYDRQCHVIIDTLKPTHQARRTALPQHRDGL